MRFPLVPWRRPRRRAILALLVFSATSLVVSAQTRQLRLVSTAWPPLTNVPGQPRFALDLVEAALGRIGVTSTTSIVDAGQFTTALLSGPFDGSGAAWRDLEREPVVMFSQAYLENRLILLARQGGDVSAKALADLKGKRVAIVEGYAYGDAVESSGPTFVRSKSEEDSLRLLLDGAVDYTLMDELVVQYIVDNYPEQARTRLALGVTPLITRPLYLAIRRSIPDAQSILDRFNAQLRVMIADHTYHRLLHVDWIRADVDGDGRIEYVAQSDRPGPVEPQRAYAITSSNLPPLETKESSERRYYFGGTIYSDWASVPQQFKGFAQNPDSSRSAASIFTFSW
jgi:polar amino acid transport system substrate-binding protein